MLAQGHLHVRFVLQGSFRLQGLKFVQDAQEELILRRLERHLIPFVFLVTQAIIQK